jgi:ureidoglycolate lyase
MTRRTLEPLPLTAGGFAPYGDLISTTGTGTEPMNEARFMRFGNLATVDVDTNGDVSIGIVQSRTPTSLPYAFDMVERHPHGSQAFVPLDRFPFVIVVGPPGETVEASDLVAFVTNGRQGINYHRGTWHMPLIALEEGQQFLVIDRAPQDDNCEERVFDEPLILAIPA